MRLNDLIQRFKNPSLNIPIVSSISQKFADMKSTIAQPFSRVSTYMANMPAKWEIPQFKLPKIGIPDFKLPTFEGLGLKFKIPDIGFPKFPPFPDVGGFFSGKIQDVSNTFQGIFDAVGGVTSDWKARHERNKLIILGVTVLFLVIGLGLAFRRK